VTVRLFFSAIVLLGIYGAAESFKGRGMPTELAKPQLKLEQMPKTFDSWKGEDTPLDPQVFQAIGAAMVINRRYQDRRAVVDLHSDVFLDYGVRLPHPPETCYEGNGCVVADGETVQIVSDAKGAHSARLLTLDRAGSRLYCLYWYQVGDVTFWNGDDLRHVVQSFRGQTTWPPMLKIMLQTSADSAEEAQRRLKEVAALVHPWTQQYH
jgi:hypothetical protein